MTALLPNREKAIVEVGKVRDYLLNDAHPDGRSKSAFFRRFGFDPAAPERLSEALALHAHTRAVSEIREQPTYGSLFALDCAIVTPDGRNPCIRTVWQVRGDGPPRLVTAYPLPDAAAS